MQHMRLQELFDVAILWNGRIGKAKSEWCFGVQLFGHNQCVQSMCKRTPDLLTFCPRLGTKELSDAESILREDVVVIAVVRSLYVPERTSKSLCQTAAALVTVAVADVNLYMFHGPDENGIQPVLPDNSIHVFAPCEVVVEYPSFFVARLLSKSAHCHFSSFNPISKIGLVQCYADVGEIAMRKIRQRELTNIC